jgi:nitrite reductase/ring-hydroxylating ferredoxin subunit
LAADGSVLCTAGSRQLLLCRSGNDWFAVAPQCSHAGAALYGGRIARGRIHCPWHGAAFDLASGAPLSPPATRPLETFPVRIREGRIEVDL